MVSEAYALRVGQMFGWDEMRVESIVTDTFIIDREGNRLFLYKGSDGQLHAHLADHTSVFILQDA